VYDEDVQYQPPPRSPIPAAVVTSLVTTVGVFFALRVAEDRGLLPKFLGDSAAAEVPSILGMRAEQAREILKGRELWLAISSEKEDAQVPAGSVASQNPMPGSQVARGTTVQAVISRGIRQVQVPDLVGLTVEEAMRRLFAAGLQVGPSQTQPNATAAAGTVVQTQPAAGALLAANSPVVLLVSAAATDKSIPRVTGMRLAKARELLEQAGFKLGKVRRIVDGEEAGGVVLEQKPPAGTAAEAGSAVDLVVNAGG